MRALGLALMLAAGAAHAQPDPTEPDADADRRSTGVVGMLRIDLAGRCCAGGLGLAIALPDQLELDVAGLRSSEWGVYVGVQYHLLAGRVRPYLAAGVPLFAFTRDMSTALAPGLRGAAGAEVVINGHLSIAVDLGVEHFFNVDDTTFESTVYVPTLAAIGRL